ISTYHHFEDPVGLLKNARSSLKQNGTLAIGEWLKATSQEKVIEQVEAAGFRLERIETFLKENDLYIYLFKINTEK
ncbi:MAG: class I SAM-dependent methyltransferase, partial [Candidatus Aminicenantes bacterium]|nr:class I SAM-dependent methyltransferase [Candidatus Aminicenantes bacterium]